MNGRDEFHDGGLAMWTMPEVSIDCGLEILALGEKRLLETRKVASSLLVAWRTITQIRSTLHVEKLLNLRNGHGIHAIPP